MDPNAKRKVHLITADGISTVCSHNTKYPLVTQNPDAVDCKRCLESHEYHWYSRGARYAQVPSPAARQWVEANDMMILHDVIERDIETVIQQWWGVAQQTRDKLYSSITQLDLRKAILEYLLEAGKNKMLRECQ